MPTSLSAKKRVRQNEQRRARNRVVKSVVRTQIRKFLAAQESGDAEAARAQFREAVRAIDRAVTRGVLHRNTAARRKSQLAGKLAQLVQPAS
jgi:small subunit ribosomal protein S20